MFFLENSGIYKIVNKINQHYYVGSTNNFNERGWKHFWMLNKNNHDNEHLQRSFNKHKKENFEFIIIKNNIPEDQLLIEEQKFLDIAKLEKDKCYNMSFIAGKIEMTKEVKEKMSNSRISLLKNGYISPTKGRHLSDYEKEHLRQINLGKKQSPETIEKRASQMRGENHFYYGKKMSKEHVNKIANSHKKPIKQLNKNTGELIKIWSSARDAADFLNLEIKNKYIVSVASTITKSCKNFNKNYSAYGFRWQYV